MDRPEHIYLSRFPRSCDGTLRKSCAQGKIARRSFRNAEPEVLSVLRFLGKINADSALYLNCPSRDPHRCICSGSII